MVTDDKRDLGQRIKQLRKGRKWSQTTLAMYARVSRPWVTQVEAGHYIEPSPVRMIRVAQVLGDDYRQWFRQIGYTLNKRVEEAEAELSPEVFDVALRLQAMTPAARTVVMSTLLPLLDALEVKPSQLERP